MPPLHIHLLGKFSVTLGEQLVGGFEASKAQEIFAYLLIHRQRPHTREVLTEHLWGSHGKDQAQKGLRQALWQVQSALNGQCAHLADALLWIDTTWVQLNPASAFWLDVAVLEESYQLVQGIPGHSLTASQAYTLVEAIHLYRGDLLEGCYQDWCLTERERLQHILLILLDKLMDYDETQSQYETAIAYGERILRYDRAREQTHRKLMQLYAKAGDRTSALRQYDACAAALASELAVKPAKRTEALYHAIKADQVEEPSSQPSTLPLLPPITSPSLPALLTHLQQMHVALTNLQNSVANDIELIETLLHAPQDVAKDAQKTLARQ